MSAAEFSTLQAVPDIADNGEPSVEWLKCIHSELVEAFADARRVRRVDQLLDLAGTLTQIADAARIEWGDTGKLMGQPRDPGRIPLLLQELELKLTGLQALGEPELAATKRLTGMANSPASIDTAVLDAIDEIKATLAAA
jgi:hypothetical protein